MFALGTSPMYFLLLMVRDVVGVRQQAAADTEGSEFGFGVLRLQGIEGSILLKQFLHKP